MTIVVVILIYAWHQTAKHNGEQRSRQGHLLGEHDVTLQPGCDECRLWLTEHGGVPFQGGVYQTFSTHYDLPGAFGSAKTRKYPAGYWDRKNFQP